MCLLVGWFGSLQPRASLPESEPNMKYRELLPIIARYLRVFNDMRLIDKYSVISFHPVYRFAVIEVNHIRRGLFYVIVEIIVDDENIIEPFAHELRIVHTLQRAEIIYTALTEL